jgi:hypothetical protein
VNPSSPAALPTFPAAPEAREEAPLLRLSLRQRAALWALVVTLFLVGTGPVWQHPWDILRLDRAIFWSYAPIPFLVAACLRWSKRLTLRAFFLDTMELTFLKYVTTFALALVLWEVSPAPLKPAPTPAPRLALSQPSEPRLAPSSIDPSTTGRLQGTLLDRGGKPVQGALVFVSSRLEGLVFSPPQTPVELTASAQGFTPTLVVAQSGQPLSARSTDGHLHTVVATSKGATRFNVPLLSHGEPTALPTQDLGAMLTLHCNVHPGPEEANGQLLILPHPFFTWTDATGHFTLRGVPAGKLQLTALFADGERREAIADLRAGGELSVEGLAKP